jgi:hypothetical protein
MRKPIPLEGCGFGLPNHAYSGRVKSEDPSVDSHDSEIARMSRLMESWVLSCSMCLRTCSLCWRP